MQIRFTGTAYSLTDVIQITVIYVDNWASMGVSLSISEYVGLCFCHCLHHKRFSHRFYCTRPSGLFVLSGYTVTNYSVPEQSTLQTLPCQAWLQNFVITISYAQTPSTQWRCIRELQSHMYKKWNKRLRSRIAICPCLFSPKSWTSIQLSMSVLSQVWNAFLFRDCKHEFVLLIRYILCWQVS